MEMSNEQLEGLVQGCQTFKELIHEIRDDFGLVVVPTGGLRVKSKILRDDYIAKMEKVGFKVNIIDEDKDISKKQYDGMPLESLKFVAIK